MANTSSGSVQQEQWLAQVEAMKSALAGLKPASISSVTSSVDWDDDDQDYSYSSASGGHDIWDYISDSELDDIDFDSPDDPDAPDAVPYSSSWLAAKYSDLALKKGGFTADALQDQIIDSLASSRPEDELQTTLTDLIGFDDLDFVIDLLSHREQIAAATRSKTRTQPTGGRLLSKSQRDEALRRRDIEHKTASLAPARSKEPDYPHVYKAYSAGNTLSHSGRRYALPLGSERKEFEKYEEYSIPAGRPGTLGPGRKLVNISDLDGLCRKTFGGYKTLNRMQSLVYPVAYKTAENMLICAPTGAVSTPMPPFTLRPDQHLAANRWDRVKRMLQC
jgi:antiviral helicase SLH1